ncbi:MAG: FAD-dependent monooxygenase, partial [Pseudomonadota bacterium]
RITDGRVGDRPSPFVLEFAHGELDEGPMGHMVEDRNLRVTLGRALADNRHIKAFHGQGVADQVVGSSSVRAVLTDGSELEAQLLIGCDGPTSPSAARAGIRRVGWRYDQTALVCAISHEKPHGGCAHQHFLPSGPLAILPLPGDCSSIVWTERRDAAHEIAQRDEAGYLDALRPRFGSFLGDIKLLGARYCYPLELSIAERMVAARLALVGDAAHRVHPIAGQGLNAGLKDVAALAEVLCNARRRGEDIGSNQVLARYQRWRRFDVAALALATDGFNRLFSNDNPITRLGRDLGLGLVGALPHLRRGLIREAAGLSGDLPRLSRGLPVS